MARTPEASAKVMPGSGWPTDSAQRSRSSASAVRPVTARSATSNPVASARPV
jgi:hypothetical protein